MDIKLTPNDVLKSTTPQVRNLVEGILKLEKEFQHYRNLSQLKDKENDLCDRIGRLIEREIKE